MGELSFTEKLIEQGFIVLGVFLAIVIFWFLQRQSNKQFSAQQEQNNKHTEEQLKLTREVTSALTQSSQSNEKLSRILDKNLEKMDKLPTRDEVAQLEQRVTKLHTTTHDKIDKINKQ